MSEMEKHTGVLKPVKLKGKSPLEYLHTLYKKELKGETYDNILNFIHEVDVSKNGITTYVIYGDDLWEVYDEYLEEEDIFIHIKKGKNIHYTVEFYNGNTILEEQLENVLDNY